jgi:hypothetical protein
MDYKSVALAYMIKLRKLVPTAMGKADTPSASSVVKTAALLSSQQIRPPVPKNGVPIRVRPWVPNLRQKRYECSAPTN